MYFIYVYRKYLSWHAKIGLKSSNITIWVKFRIKQCENPDNRNRLVIPTASKIHI